MSVDSLRYPLVGGTRQRPLAGISLNPRKLLENVQTSPVGGTQFGNSVLISTSKGKMIELANAGHRCATDVD